MLYMAVFGLSVCGVLVFVYWSTVSVIDAQSDDTIEAEITGLAEQYRERSLVGLVEIIRERVAKYDIDCDLLRVSSASVWLRANEHDTSA